MKKLISKICVFLFVLVFAIAVVNVGEAGSAAKAETAETTSPSVAEAQASSNVNVSGVITWVDNEGRAHNASNVKVELRNMNLVGSTSLGTTETNTEGFYNLSVSNTTFLEHGGVDIKLRVYAEGGGANVVKNLNNTHYVERDDTIENFSGTSLTLDFQIDPNNYTSDSDKEHAEAFRVHQAINLGARYVETKKGSKLDTIKVYYPTTEKTTCFNSKGIHILRDDKNDWDVVLHEYGHYVADYYNISTLSVGGNHDFGDCNNLKRGKADGMRLAWDEGWATYFSISAQLEMNAALLNIKYVGDLKYTDVRKDYKIDVSLETPDILYFRFGESNEMAVTAVLFDLADSGNINDENIELGFGFLWNFINDTQCKTLPDFLNALFLQCNLSGAQKREINRILTMYEIAPEPLSPNDNVDYSFSSSVPTFEWYKNGGATGTRDENSTTVYDYSNNLFVLEFYNADYELIYTTPQVQGDPDRDECTYTFSNAEWATLLNLADGVVHWTVKAWQTTEFTTGPYSSEYRTLNVPKIHTLSEQAPVQSEGFAFLGSDWYKFVAPADGKYAFLTTGNSNTYGELFSAVPFGNDTSTTGLENGSDDDSGDGNNFRIEYTLQKDSVIYLRVRGYSWLSVGSYVAQVVTLHQHVFTYRYIDANYHRLKCDCGAYSGMKSFHVIDSTYVNPNGNGRFKPCLYCRAMLDTWNGQYPIIKDKVPDDVLAASNPPQRACASDGCDEAA